MSWHRVLRSSIAGGLAFIVAGGSAWASVSLTNRDDKDYKVTIIENDGVTKTDHTVKPMQVLEGVCDKGCIMRLNDNDEDEYELEGMEKVSIEEGYLYYDDAPDAAPQRDQTKPSEAPQAPKN
ncbi:MAG: hypothetical protein R3D68_15355 [Hyphomicrobiaceae bacterium]